MSRMNYQRTNQQVRMRRFGSIDARGENDPDIGVLLRRARQRPRAPTPRPYFTKDQQRQAAADAFLEWRRQGCKPKHADIPPWEDLPPRGDK